MQLAPAQLADAQAKYEKTLIKSPIHGTVLREHHRNGESVSNSSTVPDPISTVGDKDVLRVRVDVDKTDVNKVRVGQKAYVTADAFGNQKFWGHVVRVGEQLQPKNVRTDEPTERVDRKILETLVELDKGAVLPVRLRVDTYIVGDYGVMSLLWGSRRNSEPSDKNSHVGIRLDRDVTDNLRTRYDSLLHSYRARSVMGNTARCDGRRCGFDSRRVHAPQGARFCGAKAGISSDRSNLTGRPARSYTWVVAGCCKYRELKWL